MFDTSRWASLLAGGGRSKNARASLEYLCRTYRRPVLAYLHRRAFPPDQADDVAQGFFAVLLKGRVDLAMHPERARFRRLLLSALARYATGIQAKARDTDESGSHAGDPSTERIELFPPSLTPEQCFDRAWALALLERAVLGLAREASASGRAVEFEALKEFLIESPREADHARIAAAAGLTKGGLAEAIERSRERLAELVGEALCETVEHPTDAPDELGVLRAALGGAAGL